MKSFKSYVFCSLLISLSVLSASAHLHRRQIIPTGVSTATTDKTTTTTTPASTEHSTTTTTPTSTTTSTTEASKSSSTTTTTSSPTTTRAQTPTSTSTPVSTTTISGSDVIVTLTGSAASTQSSPASSQAPASTDSSLSTGSIIGLSVAGGVALIGVIGFFVWKFTRKHISDFDDNEAIKWPDLNNHGTGNTDSHPLPVKSTGRSGFDTGSEADLALSNNYSSPDFNNPNAAVDPYAVPPLPHLNPNQPYRDDPTSVTGYYDPYRGPVPGSIEQGAPAAGEWGSEAIPMTQMGAGSGRMSPGPHMAYGAMPPHTSPQADMAVYDTSGRQSPGPYAAYGAGQQPLGGRAPSPGPQLAYAGQQPLGGRSPSPGPQLAYNAGGMPPHRT